MTATQLALPSGGEVELDVCRPCTFIWLDAGELATLPSAGERAGAEASPPVSELPPAARDAMLQMKLAAVRERVHQRSDREGDGILVHGLLDIDRLTPSDGGGGIGLVTAVTTALVALGAAAALLFADRPHWLVGAPIDGLYGFQKLMWYGVQAVHGHLYLVLGTLWLLFSFGRLVERRLGTGWMAALVVAATAAGTLAKAASWAPRDSVPGVLALVASLITFATVVDPQAEMAVPVWRWSTRSFIAIHLPLWFWGLGAAGWWVWWYVLLLQTSARRVLIAPPLVGVLVGLATWWLWRRRGAVEEGPDMGQ